MKRRNAMRLRRRPSTLHRRRGTAALTAAVVALVLATVPDVTFAADPPTFDVPPTPPFGATLTAKAGQLLEFPVQASDPDVQAAAVTQIAAGIRHTCALLVTGAVRCWGEGLFGNLGYGNTGSIGDDETPATAYASLPNGGDVDVGGAVTQVSTVSSHTCALLDTGAVRCWGRSGAGELGYGNTDIIGNDETPASAGNVDVGGTVVQISTSSGHTCALLDTGAVRCWGSGFGGELGYGNTDNIGDDETPASAYASLPNGGDVDVGGTVVQIEVGGGHTCALLDTGAVRCWGAGV